MRKSGTIKNAAFFLVFILFASLLKAQTNGDAIIYPNTYKGKKIDYFFYDVKSGDKVDNATKASDLFIDDDMNGIRIPIYGDLAHPAHPSAGVVDESYYTHVLNSIANAKLARGSKDFYLFASKKLDGQDSYPAWTKDANGVIVSEYFKLLKDFLLFMKSKSIVIDYLAIQNEELYNEGNITPQKHKEIIDLLRVFTTDNGIKMPLIVGYEDYGPNKLNWMKGLSDNGWLDRMDIYGTHYYPHLRPIDNLKADLNDAVNKPFWSTEPHWDNKDTEDDWIEAEEAICALWDQTDLGMSAFMWWSYRRTGSIRANLMREFSVPLKDAIGIDMNDKDGRGTMTYGKLQTRAFREGNIITVFAVNNHSTTSYTNYGFELYEGAISGNVTSKQWLKSQGNITPNVSNASVISANKFAFDLPAQSITIFKFELNDAAAIKKNQNQKVLSIYPTIVHAKITVSQGVGECKVIDVTGRIVLIGKAPDIDVAHLTNGIYIVIDEIGQMAKFVKK